MDEIARIAELVRKAVTDAMTGGDLHTTQYVTRVLDPAEQQRASDIALKSLQRRRAATLLESIKSK